MAPYPIAATDRAGLTAALVDRYPAGYRLAVGLCGAGGVADAVAARVLDRAAVAAPRWASAEAADRWFTRYTVLTARRPLPDTAAPPAADGDAPLAWLDVLPPQQREAFVLHHGLGLDLHRMATAMDCSTRAASNHLVAAATALRATGTTGTLGERSAGLTAALAAVVPPPVVLAAQVDRVVGRRWWRAAGWRAVTTAVVVAAGAAVAWAAWHLWQMLVF